MATPESIKEKIISCLKDAEVIIEDLTGQQNHYSISVESEIFRGKTLIEQHQEVYKALGEEMKGAIHALQINTSVPQGT